MAEKNKYFSSDRITSFIFYFSILVFIVAFNFSDTMTGGWYQQFMPNLNGQNLRDITFTDSLNGYAVTDLHYILKTTNGGDNWNIIYNDTASDHGFSRIHFVDQNTGFVGGGMYYSGSFHMLKTTNGGINWLALLTPVTQVDMFVLNKDTLWITDYSGFQGGLFISNNGGINWSLRYAGNSNPSKIYMYNYRIGFSVINSGLYKTTNSGTNWTQIPGENGFIDMFFADSLLGWKTLGDTMKYTSNGGLNWSKQLMPHGGIIFSNNLLRFSVLNRDTIWGCGGYVLYTNNQAKSILWRTTNGGVNWLFQMPDTSLLPYESFVKFSDRLHGWAYSINPMGIHTTTGGNDTFFTSVNKINSNIPNQFLLYQNYPNPFNPLSKIKYLVTANGKRLHGQSGQTANVKIIVYDVRGKEITTLVNQKQSAGEYEVEFDGTNYSSGIYFYSLIADGVLIETKKALLIK